VFVSDSVLQPFIRVGVASGAPADCSKFEVEAVDAPKSFEVGVVGNVYLTNVAQVIQQPEASAWPTMLATGIFDFSAKPPCSVARGKQPPTPLAVDILNRPRSTTQPSVGAYEFPQTSACAQPL
jgi:hypothetical protein